MEKVPSTKFWIVLKKNLEILLSAKYEILIRLKEKSGDTMSAFFEYWGFKTRKRNFKAWYKNGLETILWNFSQYKPPQNRVKNKFVEIRGVSDESKIKLSFNVFALERAKGKNNIFLDLTMKRINESQRRTRADLHVGVGQCVPVRPWEYIQLE